MALGEEQVEVAVVVVIEQAPPGAHHLDKVALVAHAVDVHEVQAGLRRYVREGGLGHSL